MNDVRYKVRPYSGEFNAPNTRLDPNASYRVKGVPGRNKALGT